MSPRTVSGAIVREVPLLDAGAEVADAVRTVIDSGLPALPVVGDDGLCGIFGEREFIEALFPSYLPTLHGAAFVTRSLESALEKRSECKLERVRDHMTRDHVEVAPDFADAQIAETFLHHRVLIVPVVDDGRIEGVIVRREFFRAVAERFLAGG